MCAPLVCGIAFSHAALAQTPPDTAKQRPTRFDVLEYAVEGNTVLQAIKIERAVTPWLGPDRTIDDIEKARASLEKTYQDAGYLTVLVDVPEQKVENGVVRLRVTEGKVERLTVTGSRYYSLNQIKSDVGAAAEGSVPYFPVLQEQLAGLNRQPDRRVTPVLRPGQTPGKVEIELKVDDTLPAHASLELNDRNSPNTDSLRAVAALRYDNLWQAQHSVALQYQTSPQHPAEVRVWSGTYLWPLGKSGNLLALYGVDSKSNVATAVGDTTVLGNGDIVGARFIVPLRSYDSFFHTLSLGLDHKNFRENVLFGGDQLKTPIAYSVASTQYTANWLEAGQHSTQLSGGITFGARGLLGNDEQQFADKRFKAHASFALFRADASHAITFDGGWGASVKASGQFAGAPVISNEQFAAGGVDSVRGYLESEAFGDDGLSARLEARTPALWGERDGPRDEMYFLTSLDGAVLRLRDPLASQEAQSHLHLASASLGMRVRAFKAVSAAADIGWPFYDSAITRAWHPRVQFKFLFDL